MGLHEDVLQATRAWLKAAANLSDGQVLIEDEVGPTDPPYLTVELTSPDGEIGQDETVYGQSGSDATAKVQGTRRATLTVRAYGSGSVDWMTEAHASLRQPNIRGTLRDAEVDIRPRGPFQSVSELLDTDIEFRAERQYTVVYAFETTEQNIGAGTEHVSFDGEIRETKDQSDADALDNVFTTD